MIKLDSGLWTDGNKDEQPKNTYRNAHHLIFDKSKNTPSKELGTKIYSNNLPANKSVLGSIEIDDDVILFFMDEVSTNDEIGIVDESGSYKSILIENLDFNIQYPVKIRYVKNANNQRILVWTDELNKLRFLNIDSIDLSSFSTKRLEVFSPTTGLLKPSSFSSTTVKKGGFLKSGTYIPIFRYRTKEGVTTNWVQSAYPVIVTAMKDDYDDLLGTPNINSGKQIKIFIPTLDSAFQFVEIGAIASVNNEITARFLYQKEIEDLKEYVISDYDNIGEALDLEQVIAAKVNYEVVKDIEIHNDELILGGCTDDIELSYQKYANNILINYDVTYTNGYDYKDNVGSNDGSIVKGFCPNEVYAFYIVFRLKDGSNSPAYHIPGRSSIAADIGTSTYNGDINDLGFTLRDFHVEDTNDGVGADTNMSYWENENEVYPDTDDFDSTSLGGDDLRETPVRHHKFPSIRALESGGSSEYGKSQMFLLRINVSNVVIPSEIVDKVETWKIYYAKPTIKNMTNLGTALTIPQGEYEDAAAENDLNKNVLISIAQPCAKGGGTGSDAVISSLDNIRFHSPDLMIGKPSINPAFLFTELKYTINALNMSAAPTGVNDPDDYISGLIYKAGDISPDSANGKLRVLINLLNADTVAASPTINQISVINNHKYIPANSIIGDVDNRVGEEHLHLKLDSTLSDLSVDEFSSSTITVVLYLATLKQVPADVYDNFYEQLNLVAVDDEQQITSAGTKSDSDLGGGDAAPFLDSHITSSGMNGDNFLTSYLDADNPSYVGLGHLVAWQFMNYTRTTLTRRYIEQGNAQTYFIPIKPAASSMIFENYDPTLGFQYKYSTDFSLLNEVNSVVPFNPYNRVISQYPHRVHRSGKINRSLLNIVFDFIEDDISVYEMPKDKGIIMGLNSYEERLLIRHEESSYITAPRQRLTNTEGQELSVSDVDVFDLRPVELMTTEKGFVGSDSKFNSFVSEFGTLIIDGKKGKIFLLSKQSGLEEISKEGMFNYFRDNLTFYNNYGYDSFSGVTTGKWKDNNRYYVFDLADINVNEFKISNHIYSTTDDNTGKIIDIKIIDNQLYAYTNLIDSSVSTSHDVVHIKKIDSPFNLGGMVIGYDSENERFLITKNNPKSLSEDNKALFRGFYSENDITNAIYLKEDQFVQYNGSTFDNIANVDDSFTVSYYPNPKKKYWGSFHPDFIPNMYIKGNNRLFAIEDVATPIIYQYNILATVGTVFGSTYDFLIELIHNDGEMIPKKYIGVNWNTRMYDVDNAFLINNTFDTIELANSYQSVTQTNLTLFTSLSSLGNVRNVKNVWRYARLKTVDGTISNRKHLTDNYLSVIFRETSANQLFLYWFDFEFNIISKR